jgi:hypothetical protein
MSTNEMQHLLDQIHAEGREVMSLEQFRTEVTTPQVQEYYDALLEMSKPEHIIIHRNPETPKLVGFSVSVDRLSMKKDN